MYRTSCCVAKQANNYQNCPIGATFFSLLLQLGKPPGRAGALYLQCILHEVQMCSSTHLKPACPHETFIVNFLIFSTAHGTE